MTKIYWTCENRLHSCDCVSTEKVCPFPEVFKPLKLVEYSEYERLREATLKQMERALNPPLVVSSNGELYPEHLIKEYSEFKKLTKLQKIKAVLNGL